MKDLLILIVAIVLFLFLGFGGFVYSATYYLFHEKNKQGSYCFRIAFGIDCFANIVGGEFIEALVSTERGLTSFGTNVSISACIGESIAENRFKAKYQWFSKLLDFVFNEKDHCINSYRKEILKLNIKK